MCDVEGRLLAQSNRPPGGVAQGLRPRQPDLFEIQRPCWKPRVLPRSETPQSEGRARPGPEPQMSAILSDAAI